MARERQIFCIGLSRTGTTSLHLALVALGYSAVHYPAQQAIKWLHGDFSSETTQEYQAYSDVPTPVFFRDLHATHPDALFIYTRRDPDAWVDSVQRHIGKTSPPSQFTILRDYNRLATYGTLDFSRSRFLDTFYQHEERVNAHFRNEPDRLLTLDLDRNFTWAPLVEFLGVSPPPSDVGFPKAASPNIGRFAAVPDEQVAERQRELLSKLGSAQP